MARTNKFSIISLTSFVMSGSLNKTSPKNGIPSNITPITIEIDNNSTERGGVRRNIPSRRSLSSGKGDSPATNPTASILVLELFISLRNEEGDILKDQEKFLQERVCHTIFQPFCTVSHSLVNLRFCQLFQSARVF